MTRATSKPGGGGGVGVAKRPQPDDDLPILLEGADVEPLEYESPRGRRAQTPTPRSGGVGDKIHSAMELAIVVIAMLAGLVLIVAGFSESGAGAGNGELAGLMRVAVGVLLLIFATGVRTYGVVRAWSRRGE